MARRKRDDEVGNQSIQQKRPRTSPATRRTNRNETAVPLEAPTPKRNTPRTARGKLFSPQGETIIDISSDSDSLSSPPSIIVTPTPPKSPRTPSLANGRVSKPVPSRTRLPTKFTVKQHEDALESFARGDTDDETESNSSPRNLESSLNLDLSGDEDEEDWEDVDLSHKRQISLDDLNNVPDTPDLEVTLERTQQSMRIKNKASSAAERKIRMHTHLLHVQCLLFHGAVRNAWLQDPKLQNDLVSRFPDLKKMWKQFNSLPPGEQLISFLDTAATSFRNKYEITKPGLRKHGYRDLSMIDKELDAKYMERFEQFQNLEEFRAAAKEFKGSRDFGAQLFTALLRGLGYAFGKQEDAHRLDRKKDDLSKDINAPSTSNTPTKTDDVSTPSSKKRKRPRQNEPESDSDDLGLPKVKAKVGGPDSDLAFPIFWSEVYLEGKWIPIDALVLKVIATTPKLVEQFEPKGKLAEEKKLVMGYVVAYDADRFAKDVTVRYVKNFPGKAKRWRVREFGVRGADGSVILYDWFKRALGSFRRNEKTDRDLIEDEELAVKPPSPKEVNKDSLSYYKNHPKYVLERNLKREEALKAGAKTVRTFTSGKGEKAREEVVYNRSDVYVCRTVENWYKEGKKVKEGETPMKQVKARPMTLARKREHELAMAENDDQPVMEGLYAEHQVELYRPPPIEDGVIPKNAYGNVDLFVDSMLPEGAVYLPYRGIPKVAKKLDIDFAEAITGFEFKSRRAIPVVGGVVVAAENEEMVMDAWHAEEAMRVEKEATKKQKEVLGRWKKFLVGLRIRQRINDVYGSNNSGST